MADPKKKLLESVERMRKLLEAAEKDKGLETVRKPLLDKNET